MQTGLIYKITNNITLHSYIGKTIQPLHKRWGSHLALAGRGGGTVMGRAIRKYGKEGFTLIVIVDNVPVLFLSAFEKYWVNYYNTFNGAGYNATAGGEGTFGLVPWNKGIPQTDAVKQKLSEANKGNKMPNPEQLRKLAIERVGAKHHNSKKANIYNFDSDVLVASNVAITEWCRDNGYNQGNLSSTARGERLQCRGIYAKYI